MVGLGVLMLATFVLAFWFSARRLPLAATRRWFLHWAVWAIPLPWLAAEFGWIVAEVGRQPWTIAGVLPTRLSVSSLQPGDLYFSLAGFTFFYTGLLIVEMFLMVRYARRGPDIPSADGPLAPPASPAPPSLAQELA
jgi:cytochrome d ubiquinol oxidase subunit I